MRGLFNSGCSVINFIECSDWLHTEIRLLDSIILQIWNIAFFASLPTKLIKISQILLTLYMDNEK